VRPRLGTRLKSAKEGWFESGLFQVTESCSQFPGRTGAESDAQSFLVDNSYPLVGPSKTIPRVVDLLLGEVLDYEEVLSGIVRLAQFAVSCNYVRAVDHETRLVPGHNVDERGRTARGSAPLRRKSLSGRPGAYYRLSVNFNGVNW
jgi:hypothetical protein